MRATRAFEIASYLTLASIVGLFVALSWLNGRMLASVEQQDEQIHGAYAAMVHVANLSAELAEIERDRSRLPWPGGQGDGVGAIAPGPSAAPLARHALLSAGVIDAPWRPPLQCLDEAVRALRPPAVPAGGVALAALGGYAFTAPTDAFGEEHDATPGELGSLLDGALQRLSLQVEQGKAAEAAGFRRLHHDALLIGVIATLPGLLLFALVRRSFATQRDAAAQLACARDSLERRVEERTADLQAANAALSQHSARIEAAREEERLRIARDVHDELGSTLTALKFELSGSLHGPNAGEQRARSRRASTDLVDEALQSVRSVIATLRPFPLEQLGLREALRWKAGQFEQLLHIPCSLSIPPELPALPPAVATAAFRIVEEALTNVARHAGASAVEIVVQADEGRLVVQVHDDGCGIVAQALSAPRSFGLLSMRERARSTGGEVQVSRRSGAGTTVRLSLPTKEDEWARPVSAC